MPKVAAMLLTKLKQVTEEWCSAKVADAVIGVPSSFSDFQRQALLDAAAIADLNVLRARALRTCIVMKDIHSLYTTIYLYSTI